MLPRRTFRTRIALLVALILGLWAVNAQAQAPRQPYSMEAIVGMLKGEVSPKRVAVLARQRGIDFQITSDAENELRRAGATDSLLATLRELAPRPNPPVETPRREVSAPAGGTVRQNPKDALKYVWIPPGTFMMGCSPEDKECDGDEKPAHRVTITKGFWMGQTEVTVGAYKRFAAAKGRQMPPEPNFSGRLLNSGWGNESMPIVDVTWDDAQAYCSWAGGRLPTEAEWEYAARAGSTAARYGNPDEIAWYPDNSGSQRLDGTKIWNEDQTNYAKRLNENGNGLHEVGQKRPNGFGLYDILGNVWEWVNDWHDKNYYQNSPAQDPTGPPNGTKRVLRGGSWGDLPRIVRVSFRNWNYPGSGGYNVGFRCGGEVSVP